MTRLLLALLLVQISPSDPKGIVSGVVLTAAGIPAAAVRVYAIPAGTPDATAATGTVFAALAQTDGTGHYRLEVPPGRYYLAAGSVESPTYYPGGTNVASARVLTINAGSTVSDINFSQYIPARAAGSPLLPLPATGVVSGIIRNADGSPAAGVFVAAVPVSRLVPTATTGSTNSRPPSTPAAFPTISQLNGRSIRLAAGGMGVLTDSTGRYRFELVPPDGYYIVAGFSNAPTFFPGSQDIKSATTITTTPTTMLDALHFTLPAVKPVPVRARVVGRFGVPAGGANLELSVLEALADLSSMLPSKEPVRLTTDKDGLVEFPPVAAGKYTLVTRLAPAAPVSSVLEIKDQPASVELSVPVNVVTGRVLWQDGTPVSDPVLNQIAFNTIADPNRNAKTIAPISKDGKFNGVLDSAEYRVYIRNLPDRYQIESITSGTVDLTKASLKLDDDHAVNLEVRVFARKDAAANVSGRIMDVLSGIPAVADRVQICCFSTGPFERLSTELLPDGSFQFSKVPAGKYELEMRGKTAARIVEPVVEVSGPGQSRLNVLSAQQFATVTLGISTDGSVQRPQQANVSVSFVPASGEKFRVTVSGPIEEMLTASLPTGILYDVSISGLPAGFKVKSLSGAPPSAPYKAESNSRLLITLTRSD